MTDLFSRQTRSEAVTVKSFERLISIAVSGDHFAASYAKTLVLPDGTELPAGSFTVDRSVVAVEVETVAVNGAPISLAEWIAMGAQFSELWRDQTEKAKAAADAAAASQVKPG